MLNKRAILILFLLIIAIGTLSSVSAGDSTDDMLSNASFDDITYLNEDDGEISDLNSEEIQSDEILESSDAGTFTSLQNKIDSASEGSAISLDKDYSYNDDFGNTKGIEITKSLTINGNGHAIDGLLKSGLLQINDVKSLVLNNITFKNGIDNNNDVIRIWNVEYVRIDSCNFTDNADYYGGAINMAYVNSATITGCNFVHNYAPYNGGGLLSRYVVNSSIVRCNFINNSAKLGGALVVGGSNFSSIVGCSFINNIANDSGGAIFFESVDNSVIADCNFQGDKVNNCGGAIYSRDSNSFSFVNSSFKDGYADFGGAIYLFKVNSSSFAGCSFNKNSVLSAGGDILAYAASQISFDLCDFRASFAQEYGGSIYFLNISYSEVNDCNFSVGTSTHGGFIFVEDSNLYLRNINANTGLVTSFGGAIASKCSNVTVSDSSFKLGIASIDAGGAIYCFKGNLDIINSTFSQNHAKFGGAVSSVESNLTVLSSRFMGNSASSFGGAIYHIYGNIHVDDSFFNKSHGGVGGAINCMMSDSLVFTDNIFLNSTAETGSSVYLICCSDDVVESGNHFEDLYHLILFYIGHDEKFVCDVKGLDYAVSNTGNFLNTYDGASSFFIRKGLNNISGKFKDSVTLDLTDLNSHDNFTIFADYNDTFTLGYDFTKFYISTTEYQYMERLYWVLINDAGDIIDGEIVAYSSTQSMNGTFDLDLKDNMLDELHHLSYYIGSGDLSVSPLNSSYSVLTEIPASYDSRDYGYITAVKDQGSAGNCWAFAGLATLEACVKKAINLSCDFSENNAKNLMAMYSLLGLHLDTNNGGYDSMIMAYLNSWLGPISDGVIEGYDESSTLSSIYFPMFHVQNIKFLPARKNSSDNELYKRAIMDYGAVSVTLNWGGAGLHAVSLVGWDDNYNAKDSLGRSTKGAWIFKNSWGTDWGDGGFGYLSYDNVFSSDVHDYCQAFTFVFNKDENYYNNYQYDDAGVSDYICSDGHVFYSNKFTCIKDLEDLTAFATYFKYPTDYKVSVYINGALVLSQSGHSDAGYYTIPFNEAIPLRYGDEFTILVENCNSGSNLFPVCQSNELNKANFKANTSFVSFDGKNWLDLYNLRNYAEFLYDGTKSKTCQMACIKAFTSKHDLLNYVHIGVSEVGSLDLNENVTILVTLEGDPYSDVLSEIDNKLFSLNINGRDYYAVISNNTAKFTISFDKAGIYTLTAQYRDNLYQSNAVQFNFTVNKSDSEIHVTGSQGDDFVKLTVNLNDKASGSVIFNVGGIEYDSQINKGVATLTLSKLNSGRYDVTAIYEGDNNFNHASGSYSFTVNKGDVVFYVSGTTKIYGTNQKASVTLKDDEGNVIPGAEITFNLNGNEIKLTTDSKGQASVPIGLAPKTYAATVSFAGNGKYNSATKNVKIVVKKATPKITASKKTFKLKTKTKKYTITLKNNLGKVMKNTKLTIKVNGKTYSAKTNSKGKATFKLTKLKKRGSFKSTITYAGSKYYNKVTKKVTITVKK